MLDHPQYGAAARELYDNARTLLDRIVARPPDHATRRLRLLARPIPTARTSCLVAGPAARNPALQHAAPAGSRCRPERRTCRSLISSRRGTAGVGDFVGAFAVTPGTARPNWPRRFERDHDDYHAIMVKALADRLAEAFAEYLHARARRDWGYGSRRTSHRARTWSPSAIGESGPRSATPPVRITARSGKLFDLLQAGRAGITLTDSFAMAPAASVSGLYFAHPAARYFTVGRIGRDQIEDYARRKGVPSARSSAGSRQICRTNLSASDSTGMSMA